MPVLTRQRETQALIIRLDTVGDLTTPSSARAAFSGYLSSW
jgi:hypothetical protein